MLQLRAHKFFACLFVASCSTRYSLFSIGWHEFRGVGESVTFLLVDVALTGYGGIACFGVGHAEEVVSSNSSGVAVVARNRVINLLSFNLGISSEELGHGGFLGLASVLTIRSVHRSSVESPGIGLELLLLDNTVSIFHVTSPELADFGRVDRLGVAVFFTLNSNDLSSSLVSSLSVIEHSLGSSGAELGSDREVNATVEIVGSR